MKKIIMTCVMIMMLFSVGCTDTVNNKQESNIKTINSEYTIDYSSASDFEKALNDGIDVNGKIVMFDVIDYQPDSAMGINCWSGEHLNFISSEKLDVNKGDIIIGLVTDKPSKILGSWKINYEVLNIEKKANDNTVDIGDNHETDATVDANTQVTESGN